MKPMFAIVEYASIRLMLVCAIATTLPRIIDSSESTISMPCQSNSSAGERDGEQAQRERERRELRRGADEQRDRRRRAVVHVRHPHVVGHRAELERDAGHDEHQPEDQNAPGSPCPVRTASPDAVDVERAGRAVDHRHPVEEHARGQRAEHEVLHRRLGRRASTCVHRHHRVERQRLQLESEVEREEVVGRDHHQHAEQREQRQHEGLAAEQAARFEVVAVE